MATCHVRLPRVASCLYALGGQNHHPPTLPAPPSLPCVHAGTLKLLYEAAIAAAASSGAELLSLGFSPFFNMRRTLFKGSTLAHAVTEFMFERANGLYSFRNLAFAKARCVGVSRRPKRQGRGPTGDDTHTRC